MIESGPNEKKRSLPIAQGNGLNTTEQEYETNARTPAAMAIPAHAWVDSPAVTRSFGIAGS